jgi:hypothetical protein
MESPELAACPRRTSEPPSSVVGFDRSMEPPPAPGVAGRLPLFAGASTALAVPIGGSASVVPADSPCAVVEVVAEAPVAAVAGVVVPVVAGVVVPVVAGVVVAAVVVVVAAVVVVVAAVVVVTTVVVVAAPTTVRVAVALSPAPPMLRAVTECGPIAAPAGTLPEYRKVPSAPTLSVPPRFEPSQRTLTRAPAVNALPFTTKGSPAWAESGLTMMVGDAWRKTRLSASKNHCMVIHRLHGGATGSLLAPIHHVSREVFIHSSTVEIALTCSCRVSECQQVRNDGGTDRPV